MKYLSFLVIILLIIPQTSFAVPSFLSTQGRILEADGGPLTGLSNVSFRLYSSQNSQSALWSQTMSVVFDNGYYSVVLGPGSPELSEDVLDGSDLYLGVTVEGLDEFSPRKQITSVPYAFRALTADSVDGPVNAVDGLFVDGQEVIDSEGNLSVELISASELDVSGTFTLPQGARSDLPEASDDNKGQLYYATDQNFVYYSNGSEWINIAAGGSGEGSCTIPIIDSLSPAQVEPGEDVTITINGSSFKSGCEIEFGSTQSESVEFISDTEVTATTGSGFDVGVYSVKITNPEGLRYILDDALYVDAAPTWITSEGRLGVLVNSSSGDHFTLEAEDSGGQTLTYSITGGDFPPGLSLAPDTGIISGDPDDVEDALEFVFEISVSDTAHIPYTISGSFSIYIFDGFGQDASAPGISCKHIMDNSSSMGDGLYWIDPNGGDPSDSFQAYCDMTHEGGGWTQICNMVRGQAGYWCGDVAHGDDPDTPMHSIDAEGLQFDNMALSLNHHDAFHSEAMSSTITFPSSISHSAHHFTQSNGRYVVFAYGGCNSFIKLNAHLTSGCNGSSDTSYWGWSPTSCGCGGDSAQTGSSLYSNPGHCNWSNNTNSDGGDAWEACETGVRVLVK